MTHAEDHAPGTEFPLALRETAREDWERAVTHPFVQELHTGTIALHDNPEFREFVAFLRAELDAAGPAAPRLAEEFFARTVHLEVEFFDQACARPLSERSR